MSFVRAEVSSTLWRWREVALLLVILALSLWWVFTGHGLMRIIGGGLAAIAILFLYPTIQVARASVAHEIETGVVEITERRIRYLGPETGAEVSIDSLVAVDIEATPNTSVWILASTDGTALKIPTGAEGADRLYDAMSALHGVNFDQMVKALGSDTEKTFTIWRKA